MVTIEPIADALCHFGTYSRIDEVTCSYLDSRCANHEELNSIFSRHNSSKTDNRYLNGFGNLPHTTNGYRLHCRTTQPACVNRQTRFATLNINRHSHQGVDETHSICPCIFHTTRYISDARHIRRKLHDKGFIVHLTNGFHHLTSTLCSYSERHTPLLHIRARDIEFDSRYRIQFVDTSSTCSIIVRTATRYVNNHVGRDIFYFRINMLAEVIHTLVLQSHTIQHTACCFSHSWVVVPFARIQRRTLHDDTTNLREIDQISKLQPISECTRCCHYRIHHLQPCYICSYICHVNSFISNTGPSLHTHTFPLTVFSTQQRQAPRPQAIRFSNETSHLT